MNWLSRTKLCLLALFGIVLLALVIGSVLLERTFGTDLAARVAAELESVLGRPVLIEKVTFTLWRGRVGLEGVTILSTEKPHGPFLKLRRADASLGIQSLWYRQIVLSHILLQDLDLHVIENARSGPKDSYPLAIPEHIEAGPVTIRIQRVRLRRGQILYERPDLRQRVQIVDLDGSARPQPGGATGSLRARSVLLKTPDAQEEFGNVAADIRINGEELVVSQLLFSWEAQQARLAGSVKQLGTDPVFSLRVEAGIPLAAIAKRAAVAQTINGTAQIEGVLEGSADHPRFSGQLAIREFGAGPLKAEDIHANGSWEAGTLRLSDLAAKTLGGALRASVVIAPERLDKTQIVFALEKVSVRALESLAQTSPLGLEGTISLEGRFLGDPRDIHDTLDAEGDLWLKSTRLSLPGKWAQLGSGFVTARAILKNRVLEIREGQGRWPAAQIDLSGQLNLNGLIKLQTLLVLDTAAFAKTLEAGNMAGQASIKAEAQGRWSDIRIHGQAQLPELVFEGKRLGRVEFPFRLVSGRFEFTRATWTLGKSRLSASGAARWNGPFPRSAEALRREIQLKSDFGFSSIRLEDLAPFAPAAWHGTGAATITGTVAGTLAAWEASVSARAEELVVRDIPLHNLKAEMNVVPTGITIKTLRVSVRETPLQASGQWSWKGAGLLQGEFGPIKLANLAGLAKELPPEKLALKGGGRGQFLIRGTSESVDGSVDGIVEGVSVAGMALGKGTTKLSLRRGEIRGEVSFPEASLEATAQGTLKEKMLTTRVKLDGTKLGPILTHLLPSQTQAIDGSASGSAILQVPLNDPAMLSGQFRVDPLKLTIGGEKWESTAPIRFGWEKGALRLDEMRLKSSFGTLTASGLMDAQKMLHFKLDGVMPLEFLAAIRPEILEAGGTLLIQGQINGTIANPKIVGSGKIQGGKFLLAAYREPLREVQADFSLSPQGVRLIKSSAALAGGRISAHGELALREWQLGSHRIQLTLQGVPAELGAGFETVWDANLEWLGMDSGSLLRGEAILERGSYTRDLSLLSLLLAPAGQSRAPMDRPLRLQIAIKLKDNLILRNSLVRTRVGGNLTLEGAAEDPVLFGTLKTRDGQFTVRRNRFQIISASARFADPRSINPFLEIVGKAKIQNYDITIIVSGKPEDLAVRLSSNPPLPEEDLLALVSFGVTREAFAQSPTGVVAGEAAQFLVEDLLGVKSTEAGLDVLELKSASDGDRTLRVGKKLNERTLVVYQQNIFDTEERRIRVEYQLLGPLLLAGEQDFRGGFGGDVVFRLRFR